MSFLPPATSRARSNGKSTTRSAWRLMPFLLLLYIISFLDRVNVGFAKLQMSADIGLSDAAYGIGAGIFFLGYCLCEIPSNLLLQRYGAKFWIARIMVVWGIISTAMMFVQTPWQFYGMRFLLGIAEAGFYPGIILYLTYWYPARLRSQICAHLLPRHCAVRRDRRPAVGLDHEHVRRPLWPARLAMAVPARRYAGDHLRGRELSSISTTARQRRNG